MSEELQLWLHCRHKHIVQFYGLACLGPDNHFERDVLGIVMEFCPGDMEQWLRQVNPDDHVAKTTACLEIAHAVCYLHNQRNMSHRDIKPSNVLVAANKTMKLCDFGLSAPANTASKRGGSVPYMSPEMHTTTASHVRRVGQFEGSRRGSDARRLKRQNKHADIYALGVLMWETFASIDMLGEFGPNTRSLGEWKSEKYSKTRPWFVRIFVCARAFASVPICAGALLTVLLVTGHTSTVCQARCSTMIVMQPADFVTC